MTLRLLTNLDDLNALAAYSEGRGVSVRVPRDLLGRILIDHNRLYRHAKATTTVEEPA